ncbi:hypothetical protein CSC74_09405 [Pseudoxanthomonas yeongjuensis]|uniref:hypothetical protein n=1 Tax=Pseudoxanthomonas yeongjuensis TaxID=377616 RepID=UPI00139142EC|nr:hypothetical protein [Pseudoxanthomonas yeongjuensis]KAF1717062.1 hypothetical protein CSC74_09405 [Pseudoxanthomonas yeongjuensis]
MLTSKAKSMFLLLAVAGLLVVVCWNRGMADWTGVAPRVEEGVSGMAIPATGWRDRSVSAPRPLGENGPHADFEGASDLYAYVQGLRARETAGDAEALWRVSRVLDYCAAYASDPTGYAADTRTISELKGAGTAAMAAARDRVGRRCARFAPVDDFSLSALRAKRLEAARAGSLAAEAALLAMGEPLSDSDEYKRDLVERVRRSGNPDAYVAISPAMGIAGSGQEVYLGSVSGTQLSELAWLLASCRLGNACGPGSVLVTSYCANGGICSRDSSQDFSAFVLDAGVPRQGADSLNLMVDSLMSDIGVAK